MTPDRAELVSADRLPDLPTLLDVGAREYRPTLKGDDGGGDGRHDPMDLRADPQQGRERDCQQRSQAYLQLSIRTHLQGSCF
jgi:hypothetical protein